MFKGKSKIQNCIAYYYLSEKEYTHTHSVCVLMMVAFVKETG